MTLFLAGGLPQQQLGNMNSLQSNIALLDTNEIDAKQIGISQAADALADVNQAGAIEAFIEAARYFGEQIFVAAPPESEAFEQLRALIHASWPQAKISPWVVSPDVALPENFNHIAGLVITEMTPTALLAALMPHKTDLSRLARASVPFLVFGSSTMTLSKYVIAGGWRHRWRQIASVDAALGLEQLELIDGLSIIAPSVEAHIDDWQSLDRAVAALQIGKMSSVVGLDHNACLMVDAVSGRTQLIGDGRLTWLSRAGSDIYLRFEQNATGQAETNVAS